MATMTVNCGSFNKTSYSGVTQYGSTVNFSIPAGATITGCSVSFTTHAAGGSTADRAFSLNGTRAHSGWAQAGALNAGLLYPGSNTFRVTLKSQTPSGSGGTSCIWNISGITLTITYTEAGGGGDPGGGGEDPPPPPPYIGNLNVSPTAITAGASLYIATGACDGNLIRHISIYRTDTNAFVASVVASYGINVGEWVFPIPVGWCEFAPNETQFQLRIELYAHYPDGGWGGVENTIVTVYVPEDIKPTIGSLTAAYNANGVNGAITKYVQNYSKVNLAMGSVSGAYGSSIIWYEITGGGLSAWSSPATLGPFSQVGNISFTAKVVDSRGRIGTNTVAINVEPYSPPAFSIPEGWRSNYDGVKNQKGTYVRLKSGASFSIIGGENAVTLKGRVYLKGGAAPAWEDMVPGTELILGGGALLFTRTYIAQMQVSDLLESRVTEFIIPTKKTGISIMAGMRGIAFGKSAETPDISDSAWPIVAPNFYPVGAIYISTDSTSPATLFGGTWAAIDAGKFLVAAGSGYPAGGTGGSATVSLGLGSGYAKLASYDEANYHAKTVSTPNWEPNRLAFLHQASIASGGYDTVIGLELGGSTSSGSIIPPWYAVNIWRRTA